MPRSHQFFRLPTATQHFLAGLLIAVAVFPAPVLARADPPKKAASPTFPDAVLLSGTLLSLQAGNFDGGGAYGAIRGFGDFGVGTTEHLGGEVVGFDGAFFCINADGAVTKLRDTDRMPYFALKRFVPDQPKLTVRDENDAQVTRRLSEAFAPDDVYAVKITGTFARISLRCVREQKPPYSTLDDALKDKPGLFEKTQIRGTIVGFRTPRYLGVLQAPEFHFHFIAADRSIGGHALAFTIADAVVESDRAEGIIVLTPKRPAKSGSNLSEFLDAKQTLPK